MTSKSTGLAICKVLTPLMGMTSRSLLLPKKSMRMESSDAKVLNILDDFSTDKYYIEHSVYKTNHISHGIIALHRLGADEGRIRRYANWYAGKMEPASKWDHKPIDNEATEEAILGKSRLSELLGQRESFYALRNYYSALLRNTHGNSITDFVAAEFPKMATGLHVAALHPLIQIGYGLDIAGGGPVVEGMAYLHFSWFPHADFPPGKVSGIHLKDIVGVIEDVGNDDELYEYMLDKAKDPSWMPWYSGSFQRKIGILLAREESIEKIYRYVLSIKLPDWFCKENMDMNGVLELSDWTIEQALVVYACAEKRNDFFLLHGVTGAWALRQVLSTFSDPNQAFDCIEYFLCVLISAYIAQNKPKIDLEYLNDSRLSTMVMDDLRKEAITLEVDEHVYKMVHICWELSQKNVDASKKNLYKLACRVAMDYKF